MQWQDGGGQMENTQKARKYIWIDPIQEGCPQVIVHRDLHISLWYEAQKASSNELSQRRRKKWNLTLK